MTFDRPFSTTATKALDRRRDRARRAAGFTLIEGMFAAVLLAASAVGVVGAMSASYQHDLFSERQRASVRSAQQLMDEVAGLPLSPASSGQVSMENFTSYSDEVESGSNGSVIQTYATPVTSTTSTSTTTSDSTSDDGLLSGTLGTVTGVVNGLLGTGSGGTSTDTTSGDTVSTGDTSDSTTLASRTVARTLSIERRDTIGGPTNTSGELALIAVQVQTIEGTPITLKRLVSSAEGKANTEP